MIKHKSMFWGKQTHQLTHSTLQLSSGLSWPLLETLLALLQSSRCSCPWRGKRFRNYTALEPAQPTSHTHSRFSKTETRVTSPVITYWKYTDTRLPWTHASRAAYSWCWCTDIYAVIRETGLWRQSMPFDTPENNFGSIYSNQSKWAFQSRSRLFIDRKVNDFQCANIKWQKWKKF